MTIFDAEQDSPAKPHSKSPAKTYHLRESPPGRPGNNAWTSVLLAFAIVIIAIGAYVYFGEKPPVAVGEVEHLSAYPVHRVMETGAGTFGAVAGNESFDQVVVLAQVRIHNQSTVPLFVHDMWAVMSIQDADYRSLAATATDFPRVFLAYPALAPLKQDPLLRDITIAPGETVDGQLVFNYPVDKQHWDMRRSLDITVSFLHQKPLVLHAPQ